MQSPPPLAKLIRSSDLSPLRAVLDSMPSAPAAASLLVTHDQDGHTPLHWAAMSDHPSLLDHLLTLLSPSQLDPLSTADLQLDQTPLHWACVAGNVRAVQSLLRAGANPLHRDAKGYDPAIHAAQYGRIDILHILLTHNPTLRNSVDHTGNSLLQWAAYYDHFPAVQYLIVVHAFPPDDLDLASSSALHRSAQADNYFVVDALLRAGADLSLPNGRGKTALDLAQPHTRSFALLRSWNSHTLTPSQPAPPRRTFRRYALVIFFVVLLLLSYSLYSRFAASTLFLSPIAHVLLHIFLVLTISSHLLATFGDPGDLQRGDRESFVRYIEQSLHKGTTDVSLLPSAFCFTCLTPRPPRSKHSRDRDVCVRLFDHECPWVNNSVGLYTRKLLMILAFSCMVSELLYVVAMMSFLTSKGESMLPALISNVPKYPLVAFTIVTHLCVGVFCLTLFITHIRLILAGRTTYEYIMADRENRIDDNSYDYGPWRNLCDFLTSSGPGTGRDRMSLSPRMLIASLSSTLSNGNKFKSQDVGLNPSSSEIDLETAQIVDSDKS